MRSMLKGAIVGALALAGASLAATELQAMPISHFDQAGTSIEKVWWRGGWGYRRGWGWRGGWGYRGYGYGWRGYGFRGGFGGPGYGYGWRRPYGYGYGWRRPYYGGYYGHIGERGPRIGSYAR